MKDNLLTHEDLSAGDLLLFNSEPVLVLQPGIGHVPVMCTDPFNGVRELKLSELSDIELTDDILKCVGMFEYSERPDAELMLNANPYNIRVDSVRKLQHLLRLAGKNEMAEQFKEKYECIKESVAG